MKTIQVGLYDFITMKRVETINVTKPDHASVLEACKLWMKDNYGGGVYDEKHEKDGNKFRLIFCREVDFFLMYKIKNQV